MEVGDLVTPVGEDFEHSIFVYLGKGLWKGWIRLYSPSDGLKIQVRETFVKAVKKCP
jgi:hypothetical protein